MALGSEPLFPTADIKAAALEFVNAKDSSQPAPAAQPTYEDNATPTYAPQSAAPQTVRAEQPQQSAPPAQTVTNAQEAAELNPTQLFKVTVQVDGKPVTEYLTGKQIVDRQMNASKFTKSMQQVRTFEKQTREQQRGIEAIRQRNAEQERILNDPGQLAAYVQAKFPHILTPQQQAHQQAQQQLQVTAPQQQFPAVDPQMLASVGDVNDAVARSIANQEAELGRRLSGLEQAAIARAEESAARVVQQTISTLRTAHEVANYDQQIDRHIAALTDELPQLSAIPQLNDLLRFEVSKLNPRTPQEMFDGIREVAAAYAEQLDAVYEKRNAVNLATRAKLTSHGVELPSGQAPQIQPVERKPFSHGGKGDWNSLKVEALNRLNFK